MIKRTRIWLAVIFLLVAVGVTVGLGTFASNQTGNPETTPTPTPTQTTLTDQELAAATSEAFAALLVKDISAQLDGEENQGQIGTSVAYEDPEGKKATIAIIYMIDIPVKYDEKLGLENLTAEIEKSNKGGEVQWSTVVAGEDEFTDPNVLQAMKIWDNRDTPANEAIVEISWSLNPDTKLKEITVSSTIY